MRSSREGLIDLPNARSSPAQVSDDLSASIGRGRRPSRLRALPNQKLMAISKPAVLVGWFSCADDKLRAAGDQ